MFGENVTMRRLVLMTILFGGFVLAGCSSSDETQTMATTSVDASELEGTWISDASALDQFEAFAALPKSDQGMVRSLHKNMYKGNTLTITSDTFSAGNPGKGQKETNYELSVVGRQGDTWTLDIVRWRGQSNEKTFHITATLKGDMLLTNHNGTLTAYSRQQ